MIQPEAQQDQSPWRHGSLGRDKGEDFSLHLEFQVPPKAWSRNARSQEITPTNYLESPEPSLLYLLTPHPPFLHLRFHTHYWLRGRGDTDPFAHSSPCSLLSVAERRNPRQKQTTMACSAASTTFISSSPSSSLAKKSLSPVMLSSPRSVAVPKPAHALSNPFLSSRIPRSVVPSRASSSRRSSFSVKASVRIFQELNSFSWSWWWMVVWIGRVTTVLLLVIDCIWVVIVEVSWNCFYRIAVNCWLSSFNQSIWREKKMGWGFLCYWWFMLWSALCCVGFLCVCVCVLFGLWLYLHLGLISDKVNAMRPCTTGFSMCRLNWSAVM